MDLDLIGAELGVQPDGDDLVPRGLWRVEDGPHVCLAGVRDGRPVEISFTGGAMVTRVRVVVPELQALGNAAGALVPDAGTPPSAVAALRRTGELGDLWRDVRVSGGPDGLVAVRRADLSGYLLDLWLLERLAEALS
ncbi:hypothetical protein Daura_11250 [Dactylosporangium aurantiacum]|uniref:Uncharacterized protein n=1 Tax=Dactylosporangium aurantiacum TaxID=35754 RepID=A0A9Q9IMU1_9ACTN|nr:hypothetical protein [Dactylosporangium aurantiacum]MDG6104316.1 hypothetical protein [Dactylosporangium aurantiacum]UWZ56692.1 hypothetical protein Daura_11250 [Dactylosporangium aurantiacum]